MFFATKTHSSTFFPQQFPICRHSDGSYDKFKNHTDSGIVTLVPVTDIPGLEVLDQSLNHWISLEKIIHGATENIRDYGTIFWGDSVEYLTKKAKASLHRVVTMVLKNRIKKILGKSR